MNKPITTEEWPIYNCHIHTFTKKHTPRYFLLWVLAEAKTGKINLKMIPVYLLGVILYLALLIFLPRSTSLLAIRGDTESLLIYPLVLLLQAILLVPLLLFLFILAALGVILLLQGFMDLLMKIRSVSPSDRADSKLMKVKKQVAEGQSKVMRSNLLIKSLVRINPASNDIFERTARFLTISAQPTQEEVFEQIKLQYPNEETVKTRFVVLPMDMGFMKLGKLATSIEGQHAELLALAKKFKPQIIPFYAADPQHPDILQRVKDNLGKDKKDKFWGVKIYPNLGYPANDKKLMEVYQFCIDGDFPIVTHCSPGGIWQYGLSREKRRSYSEPLIYKNILDTPGYENLRLCLAHFGGAEEWVKHLKGRTQENEKNKKKDEPWVRTIYEMIASGKYPNLYTDISYTVFTPKVQGLYIDLIDYLKVMLSHPLVRKHVLFGSDYYMVERENVSEKQASILLRSRLGEDLYKQIAYTNPREFLCIETNEARTIRKRKSTARSLEK